MSLLVCDRHTSNDLLLWEEYQSTDKIHAESYIYQKRISLTINIIKKFIDLNKKFFCGVSFGKDSIVLADMFLKLKPDTNIIFIHQIDNMNPYSLIVRDLFLKIHNPINYKEIAYSYKNSDSTWFKKGKPNRWYKILEEVNKEYGIHVTGIRKDESSKRRLRFKKHGLLTKNSFAPFYYLNNQDIFSYLYENNLPIHPNYAMLGLISRERIRVAALGNKEGDGIGRQEWEQLYFKDVLRRMQKQTYDFKRKLV